MNYMADIKSQKPVQDVVGEALDSASRSTRKASKVLQELDLKKAAIEALLQKADGESILFIAEKITHAKRSLAHAEQCLLEAHIKATSLTMDTNNDMNTRSGR